MLPHDNNIISSRVVKTEPIEWISLSFIQQEGFKELDQESKDKLRHSILSNQFTQPFYVWKDPESNITYCLDGKHRIDILNELVSEGKNVPSTLPATFIHCNDISEAAKLVMVYSSLYAKVTSDGLFDFIKQFDLNFEHLKSFVDMPNIDLNIINDRFMPLPDDGELIGQNKNKPVTLKITFETASQLDQIEPLIKELIEKNCPNAFYTVSAGEL